MKDEYISNIHKRNESLVKDYSLSKGDILRHKETGQLIKITSIHPVYFWVSSERLDPINGPMLNQDLSNINDFERAKGGID